ncbi:Nif11-like leader peptide family natural product precursor [Methylorubrum extorquens]|uniref:Nif11-like leader peptide family natural product precursor n=1 Tax=Methylorubrum extorquens TaxID=408 RepID=UPI0022380A59|nr:Nif11-like leader peptide family natural product precursor [Methylorubrum extorquens]UYW32647.1 Nif11-like leader peptide family natural product precursor [Methylorubrum extorquens]
MSLSSAKEFVGRLQHDAEFRREFLASKGTNSRDAFLTDMGFDFNKEEYNQARKELGLSPADLGDVFMQGRVPLAAGCGCQEA